MFATILIRTTALVAVAALMQATALSTASAQYAASVTAQPTNQDTAITPYMITPKSDPQLDYATMKSLLNQKIKYVFVIFNENESFDHEYGTFPGANGIYSTGQAPRSAADTPGFNQTYIDRATGATMTVTPYLLGPKQNSTVNDSVDHSHTGLAKKLAVDANGNPTMTGFSQDEYDNKSGSAPTSGSSGDLKGRQFANIVMSHIDCNTIPFFWQYASRFTLFDNIFATEDTPSTPNAVAMLAGQSGESQWVEHGSAGARQTVKGTINGNTYSGVSTTQGVPLVNDPNAYWGSQFDLNTPAAPSVMREPTSPGEFYGTPPNASPANIAPNLTFASVPLTAAGTNVGNVMAGNLATNREKNIGDIRQDISAIAAYGTPQVQWRWYQNGYDHEPTDTTQTVTHSNYVAHHNGAQYFGYIANNSNEMPNIRGEGDFFSDVALSNLPKAGGVFYIRGGFNNLQSLSVPIQNRSYPKALTDADIATIKAVKNGDDDHPSYSDRQISEAMTARVINAIAGNPTLWAQSAVIITYDESDGLYDHVPPRILSYGPDGLPLSRGIRVPMLVISPYARAHVVSHAEGDHNSVIETVNTIFNLPSLSSLPDEAAALQAGNASTFNAFSPVAGFQQKYLGPRDTNSSITDSLLSAFSPKRLQGTATMLPASYAMISASDVDTLPHYKGLGCSTIGIIPEDKKQHISAPPPANLNTLASTLSKYNSPAP